MPPKQSDPAGERPILIVSNRLPVTIQRGPGGIERRQSSGGLVSALDPVLRKRGGTWVGWPGSRLEPDEEISAPGDPYRIAGIPLSDTEVTRYYHGFSNRTIWPLFHHFPERARFDRRDWEIYEKVNSRFAEAASETSDTDLVWIHDYHLMRTPLHLRKLAGKSRIAFFLHIPFPPFDLFRILPWYREILRGLLAADLIGFQVEGYARNFLDCVERLLGMRVDHHSRLVQEGERTVQVGVFPIGIDFDTFEERARAAPRPSSPPREKVALGVDRLDYSKGIPERIRAFERLLDLHPEHRERVVLLQLAVPSRSQVTEYQDLKREIDEEVGRVNGRFATATWSPIRYLYRSVPPERLAALYRDADVAVVTPLRDGMNLVGKEYVASQVDDPGVLILSRLAGAAETMHEALHVNPFNMDSMADRLHRALTMEEPERRSRMLALRRRERRQNVYVWVDSFLQGAQTLRARLGPPSDEDFERWLGNFLDDHGLALFVDYDGTLTPLVDHPSEAKLSRPVRKALEAIVERPDSSVTVVSGRSLDDLKKLVKIPDVAYASNHGLDIDGPHLERFRHEDLPVFEQKTKDLAEALEDLAVVGAWVEEKGATLTYHYRAVDDEAQEHLANEARTRILAAGFQARDAHCAVEARPPIAWDKGHAVHFVLRHRYGPAWAETVRVIYLGDDQTDEDAFRVLSGLGITFRVGSADRPTLATRLLPNVAAVQALLDWLSRR
jgi:trehalose 6-phosphate synthase/phosphatase